MKEIKFKINHLFEVTNKKGVIMLIIFVGGLVLAVISASHVVPDSIGLPLTIFFICMSFFGTIGVAFLFQLFSHLTLTLKGDKVTFLRKNKKLFTIDLSEPHFFLVLLRYEKATKGTRFQKISSVLRRLLIIISQGKKEIIFEINYDIVDKELPEGIPGIRTDFNVDPELEKLHSFIDGKRLKGKFYKEPGISMGGFFLTPAKYMILKRDYDEKFYRFLKTVDEFHRYNMMLSLLSPYEIETLTFKEIFNMYKRRKKEVSSLV